jgi:porphobilinogen synthase
MASKRHEATGLERIRVAQERDRSAPGFPATRLRRNRHAEWSRRLICETSLRVEDLIWPIFVIEGRAARQPVASMPGVTRLSVDLAVEAAREAAGLGILAIALFPNTPPELRSEDGREAFNDGNLVCRAASAIKEAVPDIGIVCDVALDPYTSHGRDGLLRNGRIGMHEIGMPAIGAGRYVLQQWVFARRIQRVPAHMRNFQPGIVRLDQPHIARHPAEPVRHAMLIAALR